MVVEQKKKKILIQLLQLRHNLEQTKAVNPGGGDIFFSLVISLLMN